MKPREWTLEKRKPWPKPRVRYVQHVSLTGVSCFICSGWLPNNFQKLEMPGRSAEEAARLWYQVRDIYMGVPL